jgi:molybdopterin-containing oxidoreductase family membrane subunit
MRNENSSLAYYAWVILLLIFIAFGIYGASIVFIKGHTVLEITSEVPWGVVYLGIPWGIFIATYIYFVVTSTGICVISSLGNVFGFEGYKLIGRRSVFLSIITLLAGYIPLLVHLGHPERMYNFILTPNLNSSMWWMGFFYSFYLIFIVIEFWFLLKGDEKWAQITGLVAVVSAVSAHTTLGTVFSRVEIRPLWYGTYMPLYFILSAIINGIGIVVLATILTYWARRRKIGAELQEFLTGPLRRLWIFVIFLGMIFVTWKLTASVLYLPTYEAVMLLLTGPFLMTFWGVQILVGKIIPFLILLYPRTGKTIRGLLVAAVCIMIGKFAVRYDWTIAGEVIPVIPLLKGMLSYSPNYIELLVVLGTFAFCILAYTLGVKYLSLEVEKGEHF